MCLHFRMANNNQPTPYAYAPRRDGGKIPWELGRPQAYHVPMLMDSDEEEIGRGELFER